MESSKQHIGEHDDLPVLQTLDDVTKAVEGRDDLFIRWSSGPAADAEGVSRDALTGSPLPGLCANPLAVESWWGDRSLRGWVARRLCDYEHLREQAARPWLLRGHEQGRGPDNEPLVQCTEAVAWVGLRAVEEAEAEIARHDVEWGPLHRWDHEDAPSPGEPGER